MCQGSWESHKVDGLIRLKVIRRASLSHNQDKGGTGYRCPPRKKNILRGDLTLLNYFLYEKLLSTRVSPLVDEQMSVGLHFFEFRVSFMSCDV